MPQARNNSWSAQTPSLLATLTKPPPPSKFRTRWFQNKSHSLHPARFTAKYLEKEQDLNLPPPLLDMEPSRENLQRCNLCLHLDLRIMSFLAGSASANQETRNCYSVKQEKLTIFCVYTYTEYIDRYVYTYIYIHMHTYTYKTYTGYTEYTYIYVIDTFVVLRGKLVSVFGCHFFSFWPGVGSAFRAYPHGPGGAESGKPEKWRSR